MSATVHIFGAGGFAGAQLAALIDQHPHFTLGAITARSDAGSRLVDLYPQYRVSARMVAPNPELAAKGDFAAVAYPHADAAVLVSALVDRGVRVLDVSADHRLRDAAQYPHWYGFDHPRPDLVAEAVYGLPEVYRDQIRNARVVANPGCFPEAGILALLPMKGRLRDVIVDAKTGVSGAGKSPTATVHYSNVSENVTAYKVLSHRHTPEIAQEVGCPVIFTPHLVPVDRGLLATCYATLEGDVPTQAELLETYRSFYEGHPFVEVVEAPPSMRAVQNTNYAQVCPFVDPDSGRLVSFGVIDNLGKGAAGQAVQNLNIMAGRPEDEGLR